MTRAFLVHTQNRSKRAAMLRNVVTARVRDPTAGRDLVPALVVLERVAGVTAVAVLTHDEREIPYWRLGEQP